jgi:hypothetical protein
MSRPLKEKKRIKSPFYSILIEYNCVVFFNAIYYTALPPTIINLFAV